MRLERLRAEYKANFNPDQARDEQGRWTDEGLPPSEPTMGRIPAALIRLFAKRELGDILKPKGEPIGQKYRGAEENVRTVTRSEFETLKRELQDGAKPAQGPQSYDGQVFERPDGTQFGIRQSPGSGETIDVIRGNGTTIKDGFQVHFK